MKLTVGMATFNDFDGVYFTVESILLCTTPAEVPEIVVVDNNPGSPLGQTTRNYIQSIRGNRTAIYVPMESPRGTSVSRNAVFQHATGDYVLVMDCHVLLVPGAIQSLLQYLQTHDPCDDLIQGPLLSDDLQHVWTHFADVWRAEMWGIWQTDPRGLDPNNPPFEIPAQGLGLFCARRESWLGFNPLARGFGGEEWYIHEKYRQHRRKTLCLPSLRWVHRFGRPQGVPYPLRLYDKVRNYVLELKELGLPLDRVYKHFVLGEGEDPGDGSPPQGAFTKISEELWKYITEDPENRFEPPQQEQPKSGCGCSGQKQPQVQPLQTIEDFYKFQAENHPDLRGHIPYLRELATGKNLVVELGTGRGGSTAAFLAAKPARLISVDTVQPEWLPIIRRLVKDTKYDFVEESSLKVELPDNIDVLFIDTIHTADQLWQELNLHARKVKGYIVLHDTATFGENGENGGPGLLPALRRFLKENPQWTVYKHTQEWHGLTVITNLEEHKKPLPSTAKQVFNFAKAVAEHVASGAKMVSKETLEKRLDICALCEHRNGNRCSICGCYLIDSPTGTGGKAEWKDQSCPIGKWLKE